MRSDFLVPRVRISLERNMQPLSVLFYPKHVNSNKDTASAGPTSSVLVKDLGGAIKISNIIRKEGGSRMQGKNELFLKDHCAGLYIVWSNPERGEC